MANPELIPIVGVTKENPEPNIKPRFVARETSNILDLFFSHELKEEDMEPAHFLLQKVTLPFIGLAKTGLSRNPDIATSMRTISLEELLKVYNSIEPSNQPYDKSREAISFSVITMGAMSSSQAARIPDKESPGGIRFRYPPKLMVLPPTSPSDILERLDEIIAETRRVIDGTIKPNADFLSDPPALRNKLFWDVAKSLPVRSPAA